MENQAVSQAVRKARIESIGGETVLRLLDSDFPEINFMDGEIESAIMEDGKKLKRGMVVRVSSRYTGKGIAVIIRFHFGKKCLPIEISMGGAEGEMVACVSPHEITTFPTQEDTNLQRVAVLSLKEGEHYVK